MPETKFIASDINNIINTTLSLYQNCNQNINIEKKLTDNIPKVKIDPDQIKRALMNLIDNAIEAIENSGNVTIHSNYIAANNTVRIIVSDTGRGIKPEDKARLFLPNFSTKSKAGGLGLAIVEKIISDHHGFIKIEDNIPQGTQFIIEMPA